MSRRRNKYPSNPMQQIAGNRPPNYLLNRMGPRSRMLGDVKRECDYCGKEYGRMELVKLPNKLFICQNHLRGSLRDKLKGHHIEEGDR